MIRLLPALAAVWLCLAPAVARADPQAGTFDLAIRGLRAGVLTFSGTLDARSYAVAGRLESAGLIGALRPVRYEAQARGSVSGGVFTPARYRESADTGRRQSQATMEYRRGVPQVKTYAPPRPPAATDLVAAEQGGTVDPLTALFATLRDVPLAEACRLSLAMFDGKRRSALRLHSPEPAGDGLACTGEYRRVAGFSDEEMAEKTRFAFRLTYAPLPGEHLRVTKVVMETLYGRATMTRR